MRFQCACGKVYSQVPVLPLKCACGLVATDLAPQYGDTINRNAPTAWDAIHARLHDASFAYNPVTIEEWYRREFLPLIPLAGCSCNSHWTAYTTANPIDWSTRESAKRYFFDAHNYVSRNYSNHATMTWSDAERRYRFPKERGILQTFITWGDFTRDTLSLSQQILDKHPDVSGIAGCPRSGMRAAAEIALRLGVPLFEASAANGLRECGGGFRMRGTHIHGTPIKFEGPIVIVEDSICSGTSVRELRTVEALKNAPVFAVYADEPGMPLIDGFAVYLTLPHWFEWNFFGNGQIMRQSNVGTDWDGVLNEDCPLDCDDDGDKYVEWMNAVKPIRTPRAYPVPFIITARREAYRAVCEAWLARYRINYGKLVMFPGTFAERSQTCIGSWKAKQCDDNGVGIFVESDAYQAKKIAGLRNKITIHCGTVT